MPHIVHKQKRLNVKYKNLYSVFVTLGETFLNQMIRKIFVTCCLFFLIVFVAGAQRQKIVIYQMLPRLFGNENATNKYYGSIEENGIGKFNDINDKALDSLKTLGITYIWYTGVLEHATMTDYSKDGIKVDDPDVVKGRAGSPYAVKDYYDVDPDLAVNVQDRMKEYESLIARTHHHGLKVIMDFIPNHVARGYYSDAKPASVVSFGDRDDTSKAFSPKNDFYYILGTSFIVPRGVDAGGADFHSPLKDGKFDEHPAKATGNNVFKPNPSVDDWYETIKLNYGVDILDHDKEYFDAVPPVWLKMRDILSYWAKKGVDGFRCDVAEMVPAAFWHWMIPQIKNISPKIIFIAEAYSPEKYQHYITYGHFDYLYNKVGLYDVLKKLIKSEHNANTWDIDSVMQSQKLFSAHMLDFLENHDEERIASGVFAGNPWYAKPAMAIAATISNAPVMIYFGQELGEKAQGVEGFGGDDGKTTIFDYWSVSSVRHWIDRGKFDGGELTAEQRSLRNFYVALLQIAKENTAISDGSYQAIKDTNFNKKQFAYLRYNRQEVILVVTNFDRENVLSATIHLPGDILRTRYHRATDLLTRHQFNVIDEEIRCQVNPSGVIILKLR